MTYTFSEIDEALNSKSLHSYEIPGHMRVRFIEQFLAEHFVIGDVFPVEQKYIDVLKAAYKDLLEFGAFKNLKDE